MVDQKLRECFNGTHDIRADGVGHNAQVGLEKHCLIEVPQVAGKFIPTYRAGWATAGDPSVAGGVIDLQ